MKKQVLIFTFLVSAGLLFQACSDFLDINEDPNNPTSATLPQLLTSAEVNIAGALGATVQGLGNYTSMYVQHTVQRGNQENDYAFNSEESGVTAPWRLFYTFALTDLRDIINQGAEEGQPNYVAIAKILKAASFSYMVDMWGDIPFSEANQGAASPFPHFDDDEEIYASIHTMLNEAIAEMNPTGTKPTSDDLFYGGDLDKWRKFAKTLRLKMLVQERMVRNVSSEAQALINEGDLIGPGDDFQLNYGTTVSPSDRNPAYVQEWAPGGAYNFPNPYFFEVMMGLNTFGHGNEIYLDIVDPRIPYYFYNQLAEGESDADAENPCAYCPSRSGTPFLAIWMFSYNIDPNEGFDQSSSQSVMGLYPIGGKYDDGLGVTVNFNGNPQVPQRILTYYARKYLEAELAITGVTGGDARALFEEAVRASFDKVNEIASIGSAPPIEQDAIDSYVTAVLTRYDETDDEGKLEHIMTQKWIATYGFGVDAYTDYRRTGYPVLHDGDTDDLNVTDRGREYAVAFPYPQDELNTNPNAPEEQRLIAVDKVFWDN